MRWYLLCLSMILVLLPACAEQRRPDGADGRDGEFSLRAEVIEALEEGPVALRLTLSYEGKNPVVLFDPPPRDWGYPWLLCHQKGYDISTPKGWRRPDSDGRIWPASARYVRKQALIPPGWKFSENLFVHGWFRHIPSGRASLKVSTVVEVEGKPKKEVSTVVSINVQPATPKRVMTLLRRLERSPDFPPLDFGGELPENWVYGTRHSALVPFELRRIEVYFTDQILDFCYYLSDAPEEVHAHMVALACKPSWTCRAGLFEYWQSRGYGDPKAEDARPGFPDSIDYQYWPKHRTPLPPQEFDKLLNAKNLWTRIQTYVTFPARCSPKWKRSLLEDCRQLNRPLSDSQLATLLRNLDDDDFAVRKKASAELEQFGERVEPQLQQTLRTALPPEVKLRLRLVLERIAAAQKEPKWKPILGYWSSGSCYRDAALVVLGVLAQGSPDAELTKAARATFDKLSSSPELGKRDTSCVKIPAP